MNFLEELVKKGLINKSQIGEIKSRANEEYGGDIDEALIKSGVSEEKILETKGEYLKRGKLKQSYGNKYRKSK